MAGVDEGICSGRGVGHLAAIRDSVSGFDRLGGGLVEGRQYTCNPGKKWREKCFVRIIGRLLYWGSEQQLHG
jgi:hypothetical protein